MEMLLAFVVGFLVGGQGGSDDRNQVVDSFGTIKDSEEVAAFGASGPLPGRPNPEGGGQHGRWRRP